MASISPLQRAVRLLGYGAQRRLSEQTGIREDRLSRIVNGHVDADEDEQHALAAALDADLHELFPPATPEAKAA